MGWESFQSREIVEAVATQKNVSPEMLDPPLHEVIDPDSLETLFSSTGDGTRSQGKVEFVYHGYLVRVWADGELSVEETINCMN